ncbi:MAG: hypothetical protein SFY32_09800 [Bacteroidota bacterium]|nr:hypothetical protein [Bacteroidota bacterium]
MAFDWTSYLDLAEELMESHDNQAKLRTAISRAYYAAFVTCKIKANLPSSISIGESHKKVIDFYKENNDVPIFQTIGTCLLNLRKIRNDADYNGHFKTNWQEVEKQIGLAKYILQNLDQIDIK